MAGDESRVATYEAEFPQRFLQESDVLRGSTCGPRVALTRIMRTHSVYRHVSPWALAIVASAAFATIAVTPSTASAQDRPTDVVSVNLLDAIDGFFNLGWEHALGDSTSLYLGAEILAFRGVFDHYPGSIVGIGPILGLNFYLLGDAPEGLFLGPYAIGSWINASNGSDSNSSFGYAFGGHIGGSVLLGHFHLAAGIGAVWRAFSVDINEDQLGPRGFHPRFELSLGYAF